MDEEEEQIIDSEEPAKVELYIGHFPLSWKYGVVRDFIENLVLGVKPEKLRVLTTGRKNNSIAFVTVREDLAFKYAIHFSFFL